MINQKIQTVKEMNRTYLVLQETEDDGEEDYQMRMAAEAGISGFVPMHIRQINCHRAYYYDVSGKVSLEEWVQRRLITRQELQALFQAMFQVYGAVEAYLLDADRIRLSPSCIMVSADCREVQFCYGILGGDTFAAGLQALMEYLLTKLDHRDEETVLAGYTLYQYCRQDQCTMGEMMQVFDAYRIQKTGQKELWHPSPDTGAESADTGCQEEWWDTDMTVVLSEETPREQLISVPAEKKGGIYTENQSHRTGILGWQWLAVSILAGVLALLGSLYCLNHKANLWQKGGGLLILGIVILAAESIWGIYWFCRQKFYHPR